MDHVGGTGDEDRIDLHRSLAAGRHGLALILDLERRELAAWSSTTGRTLSTRIMARASPAGSPHA
jgi:hypothetical protein